MDDWELSAEELDSLERDALKQLAERNCSSSSATTSSTRPDASTTSNDNSTRPNVSSTSNSNSIRPNVSSLPATVPSSRSPAKPTFLSHPFVDNDQEVIRSNDNSTRPNVSSTSNSNSIRPNVSSLPATVPSSRSPAKPTFLSHPFVDNDQEVIRSNDSNRPNVSSTSNSNSIRPNVSSLPATVPSSRSPAKPTFLSHPFVDNDQEVIRRNDNSTRPNVSSTSNSNSIRPNISSLPATVPSSHSPAKPTFLSHPFVDNDQINTSQQARILPSSTVSKTIDDPPMQQQLKITVKFFLHASGNIAAKFPYDKTLIGAFHNIPRASWNAKERLWMFPLSSLSTAESILRDVPGSNVEIENLDPLVRRAIAAATALPDLQDRYNKIPSYIEARLLPFQRDGVRFILQHGGRVLLADEMGLGKTLQAIAVTSCIREAWPVLVLTPSSLRLHWASMIQQWLDIASSDILVVLSQWSGSNKGGFNIVPSNSKSPINLDGVFNIISYDTVPKLQNILLASDFKVVIADESHFLKNAQAKRTNASLPVLQKAQYVILLSGTPALSRPIELFKQLESLYPDAYKNVHEYGNRYCKGGIFGVYQGASNHEELHNLMKATVMIRRLKKDVLSELPVKRRQQVFLELGEREMRQINALFRELEVVKRKIKSCQSKEEAESLKFTEKNLINKIYTDSAEAKIPAVLDYLGTIIEAGCKFLIFAHHQPMIYSIHNFLLKKKVGCIRIDGSTPAASRQALVTEFQEKDSVKAAVLSIKAGGVGLTLTAASTVIFAELSWTPGDIIQAEDRAHRIGQVSSVNIYYLLANDTVDDIIWDVIQHKLDNLGQMLDGRENSLEVSVNQPGSSPMKKNSVNQPGSSPMKKNSVNQPGSSPMKQKTLDSYMKRCNNSNSDDEPKHKYPRN